MSVPNAIAPLEEWLRPTMDGLAQQADVRRLCLALGLGEGFKFHLLACETARAGTALVLWLPGAVERESSRSVAVMRLSPYPHDPRAARPARLTVRDLAEAVLTPLLAPGQGGSDRVVVIDACRATDRDFEVWRQVFARLNEQRNAVARRVGSSLVLLIPLGLELDFARHAPDLWSIRGLVVRIRDLDETAVSLMRTFETRVMDTGERVDLQREVARLRREAERVGDSVLLRALRPLLLRLAGAAMVSGSMDEANELVEEATDIARRLQDEEALAACLLARAELLVLRGELAVALQLLNQEVLPRLERGGDAWAIADARDQIADIWERRGELGAALRIRREEVLPMLERLGDARGRAITLRKIADIFAARGDLDEALRIHNEEVLPVFERLGDVHARAMTLGKVANIHWARGDLDEALRIRNEEVLPVFERLGDMRSLLVGRAQLALIFLWRGAPGDRDEATRLLHLALEAAESMQIPEAGWIRRILGNYNLEDP